MHEDYKREVGTQMGFLRSQIEYLQQTNQDLLRMTHINAGLIAPDAPVKSSETEQPWAKLHRGGWRDAQVQLEKKYSKDQEKTKEYWEEQVRKNEGIIEDAGIELSDYHPPSN